MKSTVMFLVLFSLNAFAGKDKFACRGECVSIYENGRGGGSIVRIGSIIGRSEVDMEEAYSEMLQLCANRATDVGIGGSLYVVKGKIESDRRSYEKIETEMSWSKESSKSTDSKGVWGVVKPSHSSRQSSTSYNRDLRESDNEFRYRVEMTNPKDDCYVLDPSAPVGIPRYIGPERPYG
jgi:hypothetical protein